MTQSDFANEYGIKKRTVENWDYRNLAPEYFILSIEKYIEAKDEAITYFKLYKDLLEKTMKGEDTND